MSRILALMPSSRELDRPSSTAATMAAACLSMRRTRFAKAGIRLRFAAVHQRFEVGAGVSGVGGAVGVAQLFCEFPGAPEPVAVPPEQAEDLAVVVVEVFAAGADGEAARRHARRPGMPGPAGMVGASAR